MVAAVARGIEKETLCGKTANSHIIQVGSRCVAREGEDDGLRWV